MSAFIIDYLSLLGRWVHLITGIAWIGGSFYFVWLDNHLVAPTAFYISREEFADWWREIGAGEVNISWHNSNSWRGFGKI